LFFYKIREQKDETGWLGAPLETIPGTGEWRMVEGVNSSTIYLIYCKNL
jgi:hypothetical protein